MRVSAKRVTLLAETPRAAAPRACVGSSPRLGARRWAVPARINVMMCPPASPVPIHAVANCTGDRAAMVVPSGESAPAVPASRHATIIPPQSPATAVCSARSGRWRRSPTTA